MLHCSTLLHFLTFFMVFIGRAMALKQGRLRWASEHVMDCNVKPDDRGDRVT